MIVYIIVAADLPVVTRNVFVERSGAPGIWEGHPLLTPSYVNVFYVSTSVY